MDELEFRKRVYADPNNLDQETLAAAGANPAFQQILDQSRAIEHRLTQLVNEPSAPTDLRQRLLMLPDQADTAGNDTQQTGGNRFLQYYALAASFLLVLGAGYFLTAQRGPSAEEIAFGQQVIAHLYHEAAEIEAINNGTLEQLYAMPAVNQVMANSGTHFGGDSFPAGMPVRYANPCVIATPFKSSHLIVQSASGALSVIAIDNSPVSQEFSISDDRFTGIVIPMSGGNLILIGEKNQDLSDYRNQIEDDMEWVI